MRTGGVRCGAWAAGVVAVCAAGCGERGATTTPATRTIERIVLEPTLKVGSVDGEVTFSLAVVLLFVWALWQSRGFGWRAGLFPWAVTVPEKYNIGHEAHFAQVTENFLKYLRAGRLPDWEVPNMLTKHATIMRAYEMSR